MLNTEELSWNYGNVDRAIASVLDALSPIRPGQLRVAIDQLAQALSKLFRSETAVSDAASAMFGRGIAEVDELMSVRAELIGHLNDLEGPDPASALAQFSDALDRYRQAQWAFVQSYGGLLSPGAEGA